MLALFGFCAFGALAQITNLSVVPVADAFVRTDAPADNYGRAGALAVAGAAATNGFGQAGGRFEALLRFSLAEAVESFDAMFGRQAWFVVRAALRLNETPAPANAIFPRGAPGTFEIGWLVGDGWTEGTGSPNVPTNDGVSYQAMSLLLDPQHDRSLGVFTNSGLTGSITFGLSLAPEFVQDIQAGSDVTLHLRPAIDTLAFVFNSRNFGTESARPRLELTVSAGSPSVVSIDPVNPGDVAVRFVARSNWTHTLQGCNRLTSGLADAWTNLFTLPAQPSDRPVEIRDPVTSATHFYRLLIVPQ